MSNQAGGELYSEVFSRVKDIYDTKSRTIAGLDPADMLGINSVEKQARSDARTVGAKVLGVTGEYPAEVLYEILPDVIRETALIKHDLLDHSRPIQIGVGGLVGFATALEMAAKGNQHTFVGMFNDTLLVLTPETTARDAINIWETERWTIQNQG